jgi:glucokinase
MTMFDLISISTGSDRLIIAKVDSETRALRLLYNKEFQLTNALLTSEIFKFLDSAGSFRAIGIAAAGIIEQNRGIIERTTTNKVRNLKLADILEKRYKVPVSLYNISVASVIGEVLFGTGKGFKNVVYLSLSTLIRGGVVTNDHVLLGKEGNAHEIGHIVVSSEGNLKCSCGSYGHWIAYCSGFGIPQFVRYLLDTKYKGSATKLRSMKNVSAKALFGLDKKDKIAHKIIVNDIGRLNAIGVANAINAYDPEIVIIGGRIAYNNPKLIMDPIIRNIGKYIVNRRPRIALSKWEGEGKFLGAVSDFLIA